MGGMINPYEHVIRKLDSLADQLAGVERRLNERLDAIMTEQQDIDAATQVLNGLVTDLGAQQQNLADILSAIQAYIAAHPDADTSELDAVIAQVTNAQSGLDQAVQNVQSVVPQQPTPPSP